MIDSLGDLLVVGYVLVSRSACRSPYLSFLEVCSEISLLGYFPVLKGVFANLCHEVRRLQRRNSHVILLICVHTPHQGPSKNDWVLTADPSHDIRRVTLSLGSQYHRWPRTVCVGEPILSLVHT